MMTTKQSSTGLLPSFLTVENAGICSMEPIVWEGAAPSGVGAPLPDSAPMAGDMSVQQAAGSGQTLVYRGALALPAQAKGKCLFLRFDSVGCFATVRLNGRVAATHTGSHTVWECPVHGTTGETLAFELELKDGAGTFSPYQKAAVLRGITLVARPQTALASVQAVTDFCDGQGLLTLTYALENATASASPLTLSAVLTDTAGAEAFAWTLDTAQTNATLACPNVQGWNAEQPALYTLTLTLAQNGSTLHQIGLCTGFTRMEQRNPQLLWNNAPLKLRGINYREPLPEEGHDLRADLQMFKQANVNFLRSLFYPLSEACLALCDEMGFYVEQCAPFQEVDQGIASTQNTPGERAGYLSQCAEMLAAGLSHPCIAIWGLGSDCSWGANFRACRNLIKTVDSKRPVNFFLPMTIPEEEPEIDLWSVANVDWRQRMDEHLDQAVIFHTPGANNAIGYATGSAPQSSKPVLHCAYAMPPCYNRTEAEHDFGIHEFWGESIWRLWDKMQQTVGCLGGAVMAAADEDGRAFPRLFAHNWGVLDSTHRPKPELHHLAMAYAPVALLACDETPDGLCLTLQNRFVHTNFTAVQFFCSVDTASGVETIPLILSAAPGATVQIKMPLAAGGVRLAYSGGGAAGTLPVRAIPAAVQTVLPAPTDGGNYTILHENGLAIAQNGLFRFAFDLATGLLTAAHVGAVQMLSDGPYLQATRLTLGAWQGALETLEPTETGVCAHIVGAYGAVCRVRFTLCIGRDGALDTRCEILSLSHPMPHAVKAGVGVDPGGLNEYGLAYTVCAAEQLCWTRDALWGACYPDDHIGRAHGTALRAQTNDFTSMKHHITNAALSTKDARLLVPCQGELSLRLEEQDDPAFVLDDTDARLTFAGKWHCMRDGCGNFCSTESLSDEAGASMELSFCGTGISVYGPHDFLYGEGEASVDGGEAQAFCQYLGIVDRPGASRGYEKRYGLPLAEFHGLEDGPHTLRVMALGKHPSGAQGAYVSIDRIVIHSPKAQKPVRLILNRNFNYARLVRGNYMRPRVAFATGDSLQITMRLCGAEGAISQSIHSKALL